jgi:16S rRNA pseudouridine516 synthase
LVLSQNGDFIQRLTFPKKKHGAFGKVYHLQLQNPLTGNEAAIFASGQLMLRSEETALRPAKFEVIDREERLVKCALFCAGFGIALFSLDRGRLQNHTF